MSNNPREAAVSQAINDDDEPDEWCVESDGALQPEKDLLTRLQGQENFQHRLL